MHVDRIDLGPVTVLRLDGDIDEDGVETLRAALLGCLKDHRGRLVLNLNELRYVSYMGVGVLVERLRQFRAINGDLKLVGLNLYTRRLFRMVGITNLFDVFETEAQAVNVYQEAA